MKLLQVKDPLKKNNNNLENDKETNVKENVIGIDLGTTNSVVSVFINGKIEVLKINNHSLIPSVVAILDNQIIVGAEALKLFKNKNSKATIFRSIKRFIGQSIINIDTKDLNVNVYNEDRSKAVRLLIKSESNSNIKSLTPEQISGFILKYLKDEAEKFLNSKITKAVITVPAYFSENSRQATKNAATLAGLTPLRLINEPTAAALAYGLDSNASGTYLIYDLGGGTFDVSLLKLNKGVFRVIATKGDLSLGGDNFDYLISLYIIKMINHKYKTNIDDNKAVELILQAKNIKEQLSNIDSTTASIQLDNESYQIKFSNADLNIALQSILNKTIEICINTLKEANTAAKDLNGIILVGGSSRIKLIRDLIKNIFNIDAYCKLNPDEVVAVGAGYQAANLNGDIKNALLLDITPLSLGIETYGGVFEKIIFRNTAIPVSKIQEFTTFKDNQTSLRLHILQGERELVKDNQSLSTFVLKGIPAMPAGVARIEVNFTVDTDGMLTVSAQEKTTQVSQSIEVRPSFGLSVDEIKEMVIDGITNAEEDIEQKLLQNTKTEAQHLINITKYALKQDSKLIPKQEIKSIEEQLELLSASINGNNKEKIKALKDQLIVVTENFAQLRMNKAIKVALEGKDVNNIN